MKEEVTMAIQCYVRWDTKYCLRDEYANPPMLNVFNHSITLLENHPKQEKANISFSISSLPSISEILRERKWITYGIGPKGDKWKELHKELMEDTTYGGCMVRTTIEFNEDLDVSVNPDNLCWNMFNWNYVLNVTVSVEDNDDVDPRNPRVRELTLSKIVSIDPAYEKLDVSFMKIMVYVVDDEYCDPDFCIRGAIPPTIVQTEFEDTFEEVRTNQMELVIILAICLAFFSFYGFLLSARYLRRKWRARRRRVEDREKKEKSKEKELGELEELRAADEEYREKRKGKKKKKKSMSLLQSPSVELGAVESSDDESVSSSEYGMSSSS